MVYIRATLDVSEKQQPALKKVSRSAGVTEFLHNGRPSGRPFLGDGAVVSLSLL